MVRARLQDARLYGILDMGYVDEMDMERVTQQLLSGGVDVLQLRAKGYSEEGVIHLLKTIAPSVVKQCRDAGVPFIVNDFPRVAVEVGADGVHVGQDDGTLEDVRTIVGDEMIVGRSTHSPDQAKEALVEGFDYIGFGPLFPTPTKQGRSGIGLENVAQVAKEVGVHIPVFCIGGIKPENLELVLASGARRVVIVSALLQAAEIDAITHMVVAALKTKN